MKKKYPGPCKLFNKKRVSVLSNKLLSVCDDNCPPNAEKSDKKSSQPATENDEQKSDGCIKKKSDNAADDEAESNGTKPDVVIDDMGNDKDKEIEKDKDKDKDKMGSGAGPSGAATNEKQKVKKKTVTFKNILETSEDINIVKKVYNPESKTPLISIIKKECLERPIRLKECVSRSLKSRKFGLSRSPKFSKCIVRPSRLTEILKNSKNNIDKLQSITFKSNNLNAFSDSTVPTPNVDNEEPEAQHHIGDKRFILPKRSAHSSRVIKPNKRFLDDLDFGIKRKNSKSNSVAATSGNSENIFAAGSAFLKSEVNIFKISADDNKEEEISEKQSDKEVEDEDEDEEEEDEEEEEEEDEEELEDEEDQENEQDLDDSQSFSDHSDNSETTCNDSKVRTFKMFKSKFDVEDENKKEKPTSSIFGKVILRQPRLQFTTSLLNNNPLASALMSCNTDSPFSANLGCDSKQESLFASSSNCCNICGSSVHRSFRHPQHTHKKFGVSCCDACRKFISKMIKKLANTSGLNGHSTIKCDKSDGTCSITPVLGLKIEHGKSTRHIFKERCHACWLKKCLTTFQIPPAIKLRLVHTLPNSMRDLESGLASGPLINVKKEKVDLTTNLFSNPVTSRLIWNSELNSSSLSTSDIKPSKFPTFSNPLTENNATFGSLPQIKLNIKEKPTIMTKTSLFEESKAEVTSTAVTIPSEKSTDSKKTNEIGAPNTNAVMKPEQTTTKTPPATEDEVKNNMPSLLELAAVTRAKSTIATTSTTTTAAATTATTTQARQRIDLKGPRVKHVCRSASIVLGQPIATFESPSAVLENLDTPPRPESPSSAQEIIVKIDPCNNCDVQNTQELALSPPATPTEAENENTIEEALVEEEQRQAPPTPPTDSSDSNSSASSKPQIVVKEAERPNTRKAAAARPPIMNQNINAITKSFNTSTKRQQNLPTITTISIDFWENYDPAEVSRTGFGLIVSEALPLRALCFLCGSAGDELLFCICCCEPYHQYCVEDEFNIRHVSLDETSTSILDITTNNANNPILNRFNWLCPRCTVCYTCNMATGTKVKCQKCCKNYHTTCLGTSKRLLCADRPMICANCLKCKSCSTTNVTKFIGNLPMCTPCFRLRQKGNFCPLCQKCYEDNDFDLKMMECGECQRWVHAKCEGLTDEQYNMLSVLPENIEFICKKCAKTSPYANTWREAVSSEFKAGLLSVIKLLSKSRQACALLKLSPRKKVTNCVCQPINANKTITFNDDFGAKKMKMDDESAYDFVDESLNPIKCYCSARILKNSEISLFDIKKKANNNEYYSLQDFNYDMNRLINSVSSEELLMAYQEFLSETFPWFQNETKACTDALEEAMCGESSDFAPQQMECDQQVVPVIDIPLDEIDDYFYEPNCKNDSRQCIFCKKAGEGDSTSESRLLYCGQNIWAHTNCALWSAEVFEEIDGSLQNVHSAISRGRLIKCADCNNKGATVGCNTKGCGLQYHFPCARNINCVFMQDKTVYCPQHVPEANRKNCDIEKVFEINRSVYVELDRRKKKFVEPLKIQFFMGSLSVKKLGKIIPAFSDQIDVLVPIDYECTRLYWSTKEPWKIVEYRIKTTIQTNNYSLGMDTGRNFTVDHTLNTNLVQRGLAQIYKWHNSLNSDDDENSLLQKETVKQFLEAVYNNSEETNDEEPQNNNDLLPPEIKDAIFEDLPHDILDGISMLDILPKLMTYDVDLSNMDDILREGTSKDGRTEDIQLEDLEVSNDNWLKTIASVGVEDALLSAIKPANGSRELKRNQNGIFSRAVANGSLQRSGSIAWSCKLEDNAVKKRKINSVVLSLGRLKNDSNERKKEESIWMRKNSLAENLSENAQNAFSAKDIFEKLKISQLDGMDDILIENYGNMMEAPVKCDRCHHAYRNHDSYQRHLEICESMSTSESESDTRSPRLISPAQFMVPSNTDIYGGNLLAAQNQQNQTISVISGLNNQTIINNHAILSNLANNQTINLNQVHQGGIPMQTSNIQQIPMQNTIPNSICQNINGTNMIIQTQNQNQQIFAQPIGVNNFTFQNGMQPIDVSTSQQNYVQTKQRYIQPAPSVQQTISIPNNILSTGINMMPQQSHQIISLGNGNQQLMTLAPQHNMMPSPQKKQIILPQVGQKKQFVTKVQQSMTKNTKRTIQQPKTIQIKKPETISQSHHQQQQIHQQAQQPQQQQIQFINSPYPIIRPASSMSATTANHQPTNNIIFQQPNQPIIVQQLGNNQLSYVTDNQLGQNTVQYLTPGNVLGGGFTVANDATNALNAGGNILVPNGQGGYTVIPTSALQIQSQPQVIGTLIQPQATTIQCGMMSTEQMVLNGTPTLEMVTDPTSGCMYLTSQPMYYGLETIVQNTVMSSQQFVSTAMPGVLSQNSSFSATTTQVFQASKIEPMVEVPTGYVVLNNNQVNPVTSTTQAIMPAPSIQTHVSQPQLQNQNQMQTHQHQQQQITQQYNNMPHVMTQPAKPTIKTTPMNVSKNQPQLVNKVMPNTTTGTMQFKTEPKYNYQAPITTEKLAPVKNYIKPKIVAKPVKQKIVQPPTSNTVTIISNQQVSMPMKPQEMPFIPPAVSAANQMPLQMIQNAVNVKKVISVPENKPNKVTKTKVKTYSGPNPPALCFPQKELPILPEIPVFSNVSSAVTITTVTTTATTVATTTTSQTASIQLPTAPYVPLSSVYSNIPTNIVNPIQQQTNNNTISLNSRPTNRVLPMQASMQISPQTPPPLKIWTNEDLNNEVISPPPNEEKDNTMIPNEEIKEIEVKNDVEDMISFEESFNKCVDEMSAGGASPMTTNDEPETPEIKNKISEILENLEHGDDCKNVENTDIQVDDMDTEPTEENNAQMMIDSIFEECRQKNDLEPIVRCSPEHENNNDSDTSSKNNGNLDNSSEVHQEILNKIRSFSTKTEGSDKSQKPIKSSSPKLLYEIQSQDGFTYKSTSIVEIWDKLFEAVQLARKAHGLMPLPEGQLEEMAGIQMLGLKTNALKFLLEQLPGVERCNQYTPQYHQKKLEIAAIPLPTSDYEDIKESQYGAARCEPYSSRSEYDMFSWLASRHRRQPMPVVSQNFDETILPRRGSGSNLPMAMRYRTLKETSKESVGVYRSHIHGRGLFCNRDIEAGEMVIEYAGELIRSTLTDQRERYYNSRGIGCYMFKIDENFVVDATMKGNAARFINHACEPNCYSKVVDILGHKHIIIFALRRIVQGEELTYDYKFPIEDVKIPCSCGSKKCRKHLN